MGYKYGKKNALTLIVSKGAVNTKDGEPYEARFPDKYVNFLFVLWDSLLFFKIISRIQAV